MKGYFLIINLIVCFTISAQHSLTIFYNNLRINEAQKKYDMYQERKLNIWNRDTAIVLDTLGDSLFKLYIHPVVISDGEKSWLQFSVNPQKSGIDPLAPNWKAGDSTKFSNFWHIDGKHKIEYAFKFKYTVDETLLKRYVIVFKEQSIKFSLASYTLIRNNRHIKTSKKWPKKLTLGSNEKSDTFWAKNKKAKYGLVLRTATLSYNVQVATQLVFSIYKKENGRITPLITNSVNNVLKPLNTDTFYISGSVDNDRYSLEIKGINFKS